VIVPPVELVVTPSEPSVAKDIITIPADPLPPFFPTPKLLPPPPPPLGGLLFTLLVAEPPVPPGPPLPPLPPFFVG